MNASEVESLPLAARPPFAHELPRLAEAFPEAPWERGALLRVLVCEAEPKRIVGLAAVILDAAPGVPAELFFFVRPRFSGREGADRLLEETCRGALELGLRQLVTLPRAAAPACAERLKARGFAPASEGGAYWFLAL